MSWNYCAISGEQLIEPVVSKKTGYVFEKRVIEKQIAATGQCPITGQALNLDDLIPVKLGTQTKPRAVTMNSVPGILKSFQNEWDSLMLETYTLKQHLETVRQELSHALYQHDAACRVIARLIKERDDARKDLISLQEKLENGRIEVEDTADDNTLKAEEIEERKKLPTSVLDSINETALRLNQIRKDRKKDAEFTSKFPTADAIGTFGPRDVRAISGDAEVTQLDVNRHMQLAISGGKGGSVTLFNIKTRQVSGTLELGGAITALAFFENNTTNGQVRFLVSTEHSADVYVYDVTEENNNNGSFKSIYSYNSVSPLISAAVHPNGQLFVLVDSSSTLTYHDLATSSQVLSVTDFVGKTKVNSVQIHPDGNLLAIACADGSTKLWNISLNQILASLESDLKGGIEILAFSENGYTLAAASKIDKVVKVFDLRKATCVKTLFNEDNQETSFEPSTLEFDRLGAVLAVGGVSGELKLVETKKWSILTTMSLHSSAITGTKFTEFSQQMVSVSLDKDLIVSSQ